MTAMSINAETKPIETRVLLRSTLSVCLLFFCISIFYSLLPALGFSLISVVVSYYFTAPIQPHMPLLTPPQVLRGIVAPVFLFSLVWVFFLLKIGNLVVINTALPIFVSIVSAAFGSVYFKIGSKPLKPRKVPYIVRFSLVTGFVSLLIIGLNYNALFY